MILVVICEFSIKTGDDRNARDRFLRKLLSFKGTYKIGRGAYCVPCAPELLAKTAEELHNSQPLNSVVHIFACESENSY